MRFFLITILFLLTTQSLFATHNRAGEIIYEHISGYTFRFTVITYTKESSTDADRDSLDLDFGDGMSLTLPRVTELSLDNDVKYNEYLGYHTYAGPGQYIVSMSDPNLIDDIINIDFGSSVDVPFYLEDTIKILDADFYGYNNSPILLQAPIDYANLYQPFIHNPNAFDPDGDSLVYELITPLMSRNTGVPGYQDLNEVLPGAGNNVSLDIHTGEMIWDAPQLVGIYSLEYLIREYRFGICIGTMIRHMQIIVEDENNRAPTITVVADTCIIAGSTLVQNFIATDPDTPPQTVTMTATGGPLSISDNPATYTTVDGNPASLLFTWNTTCDHIRRFPYQLVIKAEDNYLSSVGVPLPLTDMHTWQVQVLAPAPTGLTATATSGNDVLLTWDSLYTCSETDDFLGFMVWRKIGCDNSFDLCNNNPSSYGYVPITAIQDAYSFTDNTVVVGQEYSYIVVAVFGDVNLFGVINNQVYSALSQESCIALSLNLPVITHASVQTTDVTSGTMFIAWSKPKLPEFDTILHLPPYRYELYRSADTSLTAPLLIHTATASSYFSANDTTFTDLNLNTQDLPYSYSVVFYAGADSLGATEIASSIYLQVSPSDNRAILTWYENVPWINREYVVYRKNGMLWDSLATTTEQQYIDQPLTNGVEKCYKVKGIGEYSDTRLIRPLINYSEEVCTTPIDYILPCALELSVTNDCMTQALQGNSESFINQLSWQIPYDSCMEDIVRYQIYFRPAGAVDYLLVATLDDKSDTSYNHILDSTLAGCYHIYALDSAGNASISNLVCTENCEEYILPNTFTPNADGQNDIFKPIVNRFIDHVDMKIFDRWGVLVYTTTDPKVLWDGTYQGKPLPQATYYYKAEVYTIGDDSDTPSHKLSGFIELFR